MHYLKTTLIILLGGFLFALDQILKYLAYTNPNYSIYLWKPYLGWEYFGNTGIAFGLPFPNWLLILITPIILLGLISFYYNKKLTVFSRLALVLITVGAISNLVDRILFGLTIDYLRLFTSIINLADVAIIIGAILLIFKQKNSPITAL